MISKMSSAGIFSIDAPDLTIRYLEVANIATALLITDGR
jgi:hypothetical protein